MKRRMKFGSKTIREPERIPNNEEPLGKDLPSRIEARETALSVKELAGLVGLSDWSIRKQIERGNLPAYRIGDSIQIDPYRAARWLRACSSGAQ